MNEKLWRQVFRYNHKIKSVICAVLQWIYIHFKCIQIFCILQWWLSCLLFIFYAYVLFIPPLFCFIIFSFMTILPSGQLIMQWVYSGKNYCGKDIHCKEAFDKNILNHRTASFLLSPHSSPHVNPLPTSRQTLFLKHIDLSVLNSS